MVLDFKEAIKLIAASFVGRLNGNYSDIREIVALVDFYIRVLYLLTIAESRERGQQSLKVISSPGFGTMFAIVKQIAKSSIPKGSSFWAEKIQSCASVIVSEIEKFKVHAKYKSFKSMRDRLSHGHPLPASDEVLRVMLNDLNSLVEIVQQALDVFSGDTKIEEKGKKLGLVSEGSGGVLEISHLLTLLPGSGDVAVYSHYSSEAIYYLAPEGFLYEERAQSSVNKFCKELLADRKNSVPELGILVSTVLMDISAFTEDYSKPSFYFGDDADAGYLYVPWTRSTSDDNQSRLDAFRVGPDGRREWRSIESKEWVAYSDFLKNIANWPVLARRIKIGLEKFNQDRIEEEESRLGIFQGDEEKIPAKLKEVLGDLQQASSYKDFDLGYRVDEACKTMKPSTAVFFLVGQAGLGKTDLMYSLARGRATEIEEDPAKKEPLYLFVTSTGRTLASLEDAVNSSLNITKLLSSHGAKALCRNGLLVLLVDGFDELLGSSGYQNALGSLEPWFKELGGRGVLVASARSSYYLTQYRRSLAEKKDINVDHTLIELQPWTKIESRDFLMSRGLSSEMLEQVEDRDWGVLSVPFFCKAFSAWFMKNRQSQDEALSIFDIVVEQYLERESLKLKDPHQGSLLTRDELERLFVEIAEMMQLEKVRQIEHPDLVMCAQQILGTDSLESFRPGLSMRLSSLCGLGVGFDLTRPSQFSFSHDVMFECFLSAALQKNIKEGIRDEYFKNILSKSKVNDSVFIWMLQKNRLAIDVVPDSIRFVVDKIKDDDIVAENLGTLWCRLLKMKQGVPPTKSVKGLRLGKVVLANGGWSSLVLEKCSVDFFEVPSFGDFLIDLIDCEIDYLKCKDRRVFQRSVRSIATSKLNAVHVGDDFFDNPLQVRDLLAGLGMVPIIKVAGTSLVVEAAEYFLGRIIRRPEVPIVMTREDKEVDDYRLSWVNTFGVDVWIKFLNKLIQYKLARLDAIDASRKPKCRLAFNKTPAEILEHSGDDSSVKDFWSDLQGDQS